MKLLMTLLAGAATASAPISTTQEAAPVAIQNPDDVAAAVTKSACANHSWNNGHQGKAPTRYLRGVALTYAASYCAFKSGSSPATLQMSAPIGSVNTDALAFYAQKDAKSIHAATPLDRLETDYALLLGLGMVESSGRTWIAAPYDKANPHPDASSAEAGLYQTSANSRNADPTLRGPPALRRVIALRGLIASYSARPSECRYDVFASGHDQPVTPPVGNAGADADFQQMTKQCPSFATEYAAVMLRVKRHHYGTINQRTAEVGNICILMFKQIEKIVHCTN